MPTRGHFLSSRCFRRKQPRPRRLALKWEPQRPWRSRRNPCPARGQVLTCAAPAILHEARGWDPPEAALRLAARHRESVSESRSGGEADEHLCTCHYTQAHTQKPNENQSTEKGGKKKSLALSAACRLAGCPAWKCEVRTERSGSALPMLASRTCNPSS